MFVFTRVLQLFVDAGGEGASSAAEAVSKADFVVTMVPNDKVSSSSSSSSINNIIIITIISDIAITSPVIARNTFLFRCFAACVSKALQLSSTTCTSHTLLH
jgi:3-hydroxyisobutyrate dehydrogenase-like beta-hydroxyacid dehydrogenase